MTDEKDADVVCIWCGQGWTPTHVHNRYVGKLGQDKIDLTDDELLGLMDALDADFALNGIPSDEDLRLEILRLNETTD